MKIKEIKCGMSTTVNIGDFENVKSSLELTAEVNENEDLDKSITQLENVVMNRMRNAYKELKGKSKKNKK